MSVLDAKVTKRSRDVVRLQAEDAVRDIAPQETEPPRFTYRPPLIVQPPFAMPNF